MSEEIQELPDGSAVVLETEEVGATEERGHYDNIVSTLSVYDRNSLVTELLDLIERDKEARKERDKQQEEGIRRTGLGDEAPGGASFAGASKVVHPMLAEGCIDFSARAMKELFPPSGPVKTKIVGKDDRKKLERAKRKREYLNWQLTTQIAEYRSEKEVMLTQLPLGGSQFEKYWFDPTLKRIRMEFVPVDDILLPYAASSFYSAQRVTHCQRITRSTFEERVESGFYELESSLVDEATPEKTSSAEATEKIEGKEDSPYNEDGLRLVYEVQCLKELEDDAKPYIIHIDSSLRQIVGVYRNWTADDESFKQRDWYSENKFIPWRGVYGLGLYHLIGSLAIASTGAIRALLDSAHINNAPTAVRLKSSGRVSGGNTEVAVTAVQEIDAPTGIDDIRKAMMPMPFNPPSPVLYQLLEWLTVQAKGVVATAEEKIADVSNTMPVGTALALIEQGSQVFSSIHARLHAAQKKSLDIICRLNREHPDLKEMQRFGVTPEDFAENDDIDPVSDPNIFSEAQRYAQMQAIMQLAQDPRVQYNIVEMHRRMLDLMRVEFADDILPKPPEPITADPVTENFAVVAQGIPLKASAEQDHIAHLSEHLRFILDPLFGAGTSIAGPQLQPILAHCQEHLMLTYLAAAKTAAAVRAAQTGEASELTMAEGAAFAAQEMAKQTKGLAQQLAQAAQIVQSKMPQPPVDPAIQKTYEAAMAEVKRKADADVKTHERESAKITSQQQLEAMREQTKKDIAEAKGFNDLQIASVREQLAQRADELHQRVELMKNESDNKQHQETEIIKNLQDNVTQMQIALKQAQEAPKAEQQSVDFTPQIEQLNAALSKVEQQKSNDALTAVVDGLRATIEHLGKPVRRKFIEEGGKIVGVEDAQ